MHLSSLFFTLFYLIFNICSPNLYKRSLNNLPTNQVVQSLKLSNTSNASFIIYDNGSRSVANVVNPIANNTANSRFLAYGTNVYGYNDITSIGEYNTSLFSLGIYNTSVSRSSTSITSSFNNASVNRLSYGDMNLIEFWNYQTDSIDQIGVGDGSRYIYSGVYIDYYGILNTINSTSNISGVPYDYVDKSYYNDMLYFRDSTWVSIDYYSPLLNDSINYNGYKNYVTPYNLVPVECWIPITINLGSVSFSTYYCYIQLECAFNDSEVWYYLAQLNTGLSLSDITFNNVYIDVFNDYINVRESFSYNIGYVDGETSFNFSVITVANTFLNTEILPGFKLAYIVYLAIGLLVLPLIFRLVFH